MTRQTDTLTREAADALAATPTAVLLAKAYALTHAIDAAERAAEDYPANAAKHREREADRRAARNLITAEVLRRTGDQ